VKAGSAVALLPLSLLLLSFLTGVPAGSESRSSQPPLRKLQQVNSTVQQAGFLRAGWPVTRKTDALCELGRGKAIVFSPDLSEPGNREFFRALGFAYFEDADWRKVIAQIKSFNHDHPAAKIEVVLVQSHGTNGDALKLQAGSQPDNDRSYISIGGLLENLEGSGVRACLLAACNSGRLFRPENIQEVKPVEGNHLFEPATLGIVNASPSFDLSQSTINIGRRAESHIEIINECRISEFSPAVRSDLALVSNGRLKGTTKIAVPEMLIQLLTNDQRLNLVSGGYDVIKSSAETNDNYREQLINRFLRLVNSVGERGNRADSSSANMAE